jgi:hypothetical protein
LAQLRKNAIAVGSGTPSSARGCRIAEITGFESPQIDGDFPALQDSTPFNAQFKFAAAQALKHAIASS